MSASLLYHACGIMGFPYVRACYLEGGWSSGLIEIVLSCAVLGVRVTK
jgi:hypothetical protein